MKEDNFFIKSFYIGIIPFFILVILFHQVVGPNNERLESRSALEFEEKRGSIWFSDNEQNIYEAATNVYKKDLLINPQYIDDFEELYEWVSTIVEIDKDIFINNVSNNNSQYLKIKSDLSDEELAKYENAKSFFNLKALYVDDKVVVRRKPYGDLLKQTIGLTKIEKNKIKAISGLEKQYNTILKNETASDSGIVLNIDINVQTRLKNILDNLHSGEESIATGGFIINPKDGNIYAMVSVNSEDDDEYKNILTQNVYEFGSVFKPLTVAIGLDSYAINSDFTYNDTGSFSSDTETIYNYDLKARGPDTSLQDILSLSLNVGIANIVEDTGIGTISKYFKELGLQEQPKIDLINQANNISNNLNSDILIDLVTIGYGAGLAVTPASFVSAVSALANDGYTVNPTIVSGFRKNGIFFHNDVIHKRKSVFRKDTVDEIRKMMIYTFDNVLLGGTLKKENYTVATKTGTAELLDVETGKYLEDRSLHSFFGFFPATDPEYLVFLFTVDPKNGQYASNTLSIPFSDTVDYLIDYYQVQPDR